MTKRLYFEEPYRTSFEATVVGRLDEGDFDALILDQTLFYPTSGGQPHDLGNINGAAVLDVYARENDGEIVHVMGGQVAANIVSGNILWDRRFDHMQQHSGQHILSQAFLQVANAPTLSFHLGNQSSSIDLEYDKIALDHLNEAEQLANKIVWSNRSIQQRFVHYDELEPLAIRKVPDLNTDSYRLIEIADFDICACGGTHVSQTGEIGLIKIIGSERRGQELRIEFVCGDRALRDYDRKNTILTSLSTKLTTAYSEIEKTIDKLHEENKQLKKELRNQKNTLMAYEASSLSDKVEVIGSTPVICTLVHSYDMGSLRMLANQLISQKKVLVLLGQPGENSLFVFAASEGIMIDVNRLLKDTFTFIGAGNGGGSKSFAQGGGITLSGDTVQQALQWAKTEIGKG